MEFAITVLRIRNSADGMVEIVAWLVVWRIQTLLLLQTVVLGVTIATTQKCFTQRVYQPHLPHFQPQALQLNPQIFPVAGRPGCQLHFHLTCPLDCRQVILAMSHPHHQVESLLHSPLPSLVESLLYVLRVPRRVTQAVNQVVGRPVYQVVSHQRGQVVLLVLNLVVSPQQARQVNQAEFPLVSPVQYLVVSPRATLVAYLAFNLPVSPPHHPVRAPQVFPVDCQRNPPVSRPLHVRQERL